MTATQPDTDEKDRSTISRRGVMRTTAAGVGAAATLGGASRMGVSPVGSAQAIAPALAALAGGAATGYVLRGIQNPFTGDTNEEYDESNADATRQQIVENGLSMRQSDEAVLGNMLNLVNASSNHVIAQAKKAAIDEFEAGNDTAAAETAAVTVIDDFYATQQTNLLTHFEAQLSRYSSHNEQADVPNDLERKDVFAGQDGDSIDNYAGYQNSGTTNIDYNLVDGSSYSVTTPEIDISGYTGSRALELDSSYAPKIYTESVDGSFQGYLFLPPYTEVWNEIPTTHADVSNNIQTWVNDVGVSYATGDIETGDLISPNDLIGDSQTEDGYSFAGADLASMGLKTSDFALTIELVESGETVEGAIYHQDDATDTLEKGVEYDPETDISGTVYLAFDDGEKTDLIVLREPFIIKSITNSAGEELTQATYESKNQQTYNTEINEIQKELDQIADIRQDLEEQRNAAAKDDGGGGAGAGFFDSIESDGQTLGLVAAGGALLALLLGRN